jgi:hypothetical protein
MKSPSQNYDFGHSFDVRSLVGPSRAHDDVRRTFRMFVGAPMFTLGAFAASGR